MAERPANGNNDQDIRPGLSDDRGMETAKVMTVNMVHELRPGYFHETAIDKRPVQGPVAVDEDGLVGDRQMDRNHGGKDKAVYVYADEDAAWWAAKLERDVPPGLLGENLRTSGLDVTGALIGERWRIGDVILVVSGPRTPCQNLALRVGIDDFHIEFNGSGRVGAMTQVARTGAISAGDSITVEWRPEHDLTIASLARGPSPTSMRRLLDSGVPLTSSLRSKARRIASRVDR